MSTFEKILSDLDKQILDSYLTKKMMKHKRMHARGYVEDGFSVEWYPNGSEHITVYIPKKSNLPRKEAKIKFIGNPLQGEVCQVHVLRVSIHDDYDDNFASLVGALDTELRNSGGDETNSTMANYKKDRALAFVEQGYSVEWFPDTSNQMEIYEMIAGRSLLEARALVTFSDLPQENGLNKGTITRLEMKAKMLKPLSDSSSSVEYLFEDGVEKNQGFRHELMGEIYPSFQDLYELVIAEFQKPSPYFQHLKLKGFERD